MRPLNDLRFLSSPLLYSLSYVVHDNWVTSEEADLLDPYSELRKFLLRATNLRRLGIYGSSRFIAPASLHLPLQPSDRLLPLHALRLSGYSELFGFDGEHCRTFSQCMDWTRLRRLDLGNYCPRHLFEEISSRLSNLKSLTMGIETDKNGDSTSESLIPIVKFIECLPGLHVLRLTDFTNAIETMSSVIVNSQASLQELSYLAAGYQKDIRRPSSEKLPSGWEPSQLRDLILRNPELSRLKIDVPLVERKWVSHHLDNPL